MIAIVSSAIFAQTSTSVGTSTPVRTGDSLSGIRNTANNTEYSTLASLASAQPLIRQTLTDLQLQVTQNGSVRVVVGVRADFTPEGALRSEHAVRQRDSIRSVQAAILNAHPTIASKRDKVHFFESIPFMAMEVDGSELESLSNNADITSLEEDRLDITTLAESTVVIGATAARSSGFSGLGQTIAIVDTGVDKTHPFLSGRVISEACYSTTSSANSSTSVCPGGLSESTSSGSGVNCGAGCDHGTHVAGIAAGRGSSFSGVAPDANIISIQVFSRFTGATVCGSEPTCIRTYTSDQIKALERVYALRSTYNIASVNMSLGGGRNFSQSSCDTANASRKAIIDNLRAANIATVIASGNDGYTDSMGAPGCISSAISVGATHDATGSSNACSGTVTVNQVACYSNSVSFLNLLAPGSLITSSIPGGVYSGYNGTSMATPHVAGAFAVLRQKVSSLSVSAGLNALASTGLSVTDRRNGIVKPRIQLDAALSSLGGGSTNFLLTVSKLGAGTGSVTSAPVGIDCGADCTESYPSGTRVTLTATPSAGSVFTGWTGGCATTSASCSFTVTVNTTVNATFSRGDDGFPPGGIPAGWIQPVGSNAPWVFSTTASFAGSSSLKSGLITNSQKSGIAFTANFSAGMVSFARKVSSEASFDYLRFYVDGVMRGEWSGELDWLVVSYPLTAGTHEIKWQYEKDSSLSVGSDTAWIDTVSLPNIGGGPDLIVTAASAPTTALSGGNINVAFTVGNQGTSSSGSSFMGILVSTNNIISSFDTDTGWGCDIPILAPGATHSCAGPITLPKLDAGSYFVGGLADQGNVVLESNENNNGLAATNTTTITVFGPDLIVTSVSAPGTGVSGGNINVAFVVMNQGTSSSPASRLGIFLSVNNIISSADTDTGFGCDIPALAPGATSSCAGLLTLPRIAAGVYFVGGFADIRNEVVESNENNNGRAAANTTVITSTPTFNMVPILDLLLFNDQDRLRFPATPPQ